MTVLFAAFFVWNDSNAQVDFYIENQLVDQSQVYVYNHAGGASANLEMRLENTSADTLEVNVDICLLEDSPNWEMNSIAWAHENDQFGGIHAGVSYDTSDCWLMTYSSFDVDLLPAESALLMSYLDVYGTGCEKYRYYVRNGTTVVDSIDIHYCATLSLKESVAPLVSMYPNPSGGSFHVSGAGEVSGIEVYDLSGRPVAVEFNGSVLTMREPQNGYYIVRISFVNGAVRSECITVQ